MSVLARLWDRVAGTQPLPPAWVIAATALVALAAVLNTGSWRLAGKVITIAHEGGHALVSVLSGRRLDGLRLHADSSGVTYWRGARGARAGRGPSGAARVAAGLGRRPARPAARAPGRRGGPAVGAGVGGRPGQRGPPASSPRPPLLTPPRAAPDGAAVPRLRAA